MGDMLSMARSGQLVDPVEPAGLAGGKTRRGLLGAEDDGVDEVVASVMLWPLAETSTASRDSSVRLSGMIVGAMISVP
jgi:hypothetical protein